MYVCVGQTFVSKSLGILGTCVDKSGNGTLRVKEKKKKRKTPAFYAGQKSTQVKMRHMRD